MAAKKKTMKKTTAKKKTAGKAARPAKAKARAGAAAKKPSALKAAGKKAAPRPMPSLPAAEKKKTPLGNLSEREKLILAIRDKLVAQRGSLLSEAENAMTALPDQTVFPDLGDQATAETDMNFMLRLRGREQRLLKKIDEAIERIDSGVYGMCEVCGEPIGIERLTARPVTTMCIDCKTEQESEEKISGQ